MEATKKRKRGGRATARERARFARHMQVLVGELAELAETGIGQGLTREHIITSFVEQLLGHR